MESTASKAPLADLTEQVCVRYDITASVVLARPTSRREQGDPALSKCCIWRYRLLLTRNYCLAQLLTHTFTLHQRPSARAV